MTRIGLRRRARAHRGVCVAAMLWGCGSLAHGADHGVVLLYHHIDDSTPAATSVVPHQFRAHLDYLDGEGFTVLRLSAMLGALARGGCLVFPGAQPGRPLSENTHSKLLRELGFATVTHGFRSSFRDRAAEQTNAPHAVMEAALAHTIRNKVEAAYAPSGLFEKRRALMEAWAKYLETEEAYSGLVVVRGAVMRDCRVAVRPVRIPGGRRRRNAEALSSNRSSERARSGRTVVRPARGVVRRGLP